MNWTSLRCPLPGVAREAKLVIGFISAQKDQQSAKILSKRILFNGAGLAQVLYQKQGRKSQFGSEAERDSWVKQEMEHLETQRSKRLEQLKSLADEIKQLNSDLMDFSQVRIGLAHRP